MISTTFARQRVLPDSRLGSSVRFPRHQIRRFRGVCWVGSVSPVFRSGRLVREANDGLMVMSECWQMVVS